MKHKNVSGVFSDDIYTHGARVPNSGLTPRNNRKRCCKVCGQRLSAYNLNVVCHAHLAQWRKMQDQKEQDLLYKRRQQARRKADAKKKHRVVDNKS